MTPRTFHNFLKGKIKRDRAESQRREFEIHRLELAMLGPHMKKADRDKAYRGLYAMVETAPERKKKPKQNPVDFWKKIDGKET